MTSYNSNGAIIGFGTSVAWTGRFPSYYLSQLRADGVYYFCQDIEANWNDGGNHAGEIGKKWWPDTGAWRDTRFRLPEHHRGRTSVTFLDNSAMIVSGGKWEEWDRDRPGRFYYNPGSETGDNHNPF
ncbi:MAG: hypothetical protein MK132_25375 [Lentisphaerales bacterium]|nr:hypothetical protein [Lentisphaerales bacterium]